MVVLVVVVVDCESCSPSPTSAAAASNAWVRVRERVRLCERVRYPVLPRPSGPDLSRAPTQICTHLYSAEVPTARCGHKGGPTRGPRLKVEVAPRLVKERVWVRREAVSLSGRGSWRMEIIP